MRVTVDLDDADPLDVEVAWRRLSRFGDGEVSGRVSSGGDGCHLKVHGSRRDDREIRKVRRMCGDDPKRVDIDGNPHRPSPSQVLWDSKDGGTVGPWRDNLGELLDDLFPPQAESVGDFPRARGTVPVDGQPQG